MRTVVRVGMLSRCRDERWAVPTVRLLHLLSVDGKQDLRITSHAEFDGLPVFSPDGKTLMWTAKRNGISSAQLFLADFVGLTPGGELAK